MFVQFFLFGMWSVLYAYTPEALSLANTSHRNRLCICDRAHRISHRPYVIGVILPTADQACVFAFGAGAFMPSAVDRIGAWRGDMWSNPRKHLVLKSRHRNS
jgi:MFS transporter, putative metabolite:H+ symporter